MTAAIIGTGFMARTHAEALARIGVLVAGVVGSRTVEYAHTYGSFDEMLDDPRVDIVHICSPNHLHFEQAMACLQAGKHVMCEKPLAMSSSQAHMLSAAATELGLLNAVCFLSRFYPLCQEAASRSVGDVRLVTGNYLQDWLSEDTDWNWRLDPAIGGPLRVVGDIGSHWLDLVGFVTGQRVESVMADLTTVLPVRRGSDVTTEDVAGVLLRFSGGARGVLTLSQVSPGRKNHLSFEISGSEASLAWNSENPDQLWTGHRSSPNQLELRSAGDYPAGHAMGYPDAFKAFFRAVYSGGEYPSFEDGLEQVLIGEAIAESARLGQWTPVQR